MFNKTLLLCLLLQMKNEYNAWNCIKNVLNNNLLDIINNKK